MLKGVRVAVSVAMLGVVTALCTLGWSALGWAGAIQIVPLALAGSVTGLTVWVGVTLLLGRVYCSTVCPLGTLQDAFARLPRLGRHGRYRYERGRTRFRVTWLIAIAGCCIAGCVAVLIWTDPMATYVRIADGLLWRPESAGTNGSGVVIASAGLAFAVGLATLLAVGWVSARRGRLICNTVCPVGSALGLVGRVALMHFDIDTDLCTNCRRCERVCKGACIDLQDHLVDASRCVVCFDCMAVCPDNAIRYTHRHKKLSLPLMQPVKPLPSLTFDENGTAAASPLAPIKDNTEQQCNNISTFCSGFSARECRKPTAQAPEPGACSATRCASISPTDSRC